MLAVTYDQIGNPLNDGTWTYTWEKGRQLKCMSESGTTASFKYNENGLRIQKTVNGVVTNYTLHGKNIMHMTQGSNSLHFYYDASNKPAIVEYNGTKYGYILNLQGDFLGLVDSNGTEVVKYVYDAWGKILSTTGSIASTLGTIQPFRYRSYVYDQETELYYLRSRYYNPNWCRFVNADIFLAFVGTVQQSNAMAYATNSPINRADENGCTSTTSIMNMLITRIHNAVSIVLHTQQMKETPDPKKPTVTVSTLMSNLQYLVDKKKDVSAEKDTGCAMFIRAGILGKKGRHSHNEYHAGMTSMFENNMVFWGKITDIGGTAGLVPGMILGEHQDKEHFVSHGGVYYGLYDFGDGPEPAVYSFDTKRKRGHLHPYTDNDWFYYGWHEGVILD